MIGYVSGPLLEMDLRQVFIAKRARLHGRTVGNARQFDAMNRALEAHGIVPLIDSVHPFADAAAAYRRGPARTSARSWSSWIDQDLTGRRG